MTWVPNINVNKYCICVLFVLYPIYFIFYELFVIKLYFNIYVFVIICRACSIRANIIIDSIVYGLNILGNPQKKVIFLVAWPVGSQDTV